jgi:4-diphosphocytidyl-2-C-methyl-D-erythritol kinase
MIVFPHAKINLGLRVLDRRPDGFHNIESVFCPVPWRDALEVVKARSFSFQPFGRAIAGESNDNLCVRAYRLLQEPFHLPPVTLCLLKNIPAGAGLGGGSSDAAFTLRLLNSYFGLNCSADELRKFAAQLGSDCPFFIEDRACLVRGRGEHLQPLDLDLSRYYLVIVKTPVAVNTAWAYSELSRFRNETGFRLPEERRPPEQLLSAPVETWKEFLQNDFEEVVFREHPSLAEMKDQLYRHGALYAAMSGSGAAVFGIFSEQPSLSFDSSVISFTGQLRLF